MSARTRLLQVCATETKGESGSPGGCEDPLAEWRQEVYNKRQRAF